MAMDSEEVRRLAAERISRAQELLAKTRKQVEDTRVTARSADNLITVVTDGQGELVSITFNTARWRRMAPAELGAALVKTVNQAREDARAELMNSYSGVLPRPLVRLGAGGGRVNLEEMVNSLLDRGAGG